MWARNDVEETVAQKMALEFAWREQAELRRTLPSRVSNRGHPEHKTEASTITKVTTHRTSCGRAYHSFSTTFRPFFRPWPHRCRDCKTTEFLRGVKLAQSQPPRPGEPGYLCPAPCVKTCGCNRHRYETVGTSNRYIKTVHHRTTPIPSNPFLCSHSLLFL